VVSTGIAIALAAGIAARWQPFPVQFTRHAMGQTVAISLDGGKVRKTFAGKMVIRDRFGTCASVCADVRGPVSRGQVFQVRPRPSSKVGGRVALAGNIVARHLWEAQTPDQCAALQLAVWEATEDGGERADFYSGRFQARASGAVMALAANYYAAVDEPREALHLAATSGGQSQLTAPQITGPPVDPP